MIDRSFYVYLHYQPYQSYPFYIGKGKEDRAYNKTKRSAEWKAEAAKGLEVVIHASNLPEACAFTLEKILIAQSYRDYVVNKCAGGAGMSGHRHTDETKQKMREGRVGEKNPMFGKSQSDDLRSKRREWTTGRNHPQFDWTVYSFYHPDHGKVDCLRSELIERYGLSPPKVCNIISGKRKTHQGWSKTS